eukprot:TRINITY_DN533_c0_g2_i2.p1 TRINITY_DN533_c0_g2~~TRINITY_DN533_c0_g2_i2.p1  ORF type:complete len:203 (+),score=35.27 TRINITY_DN533_c0_g2_i2:96-704(+)
MFRRLQRLRHDRNASETLQRQSTGSILPNSNLQAINGGILHQRQSLPELMASEAEALQSLDSDPESESSLESFGDAGTARRRTTHEPEALGNLDYRTRPPHEARERSITFEFGSGVFRPLWAGGPWIPWDCPGSDSESQELPHILENEELHQDIDDELLVSINGFEWGELDFEAATTLPSPAVTDLGGSQSSKASSMWSAVS